MTRKKPVVFPFAQKVEKLQKKERSGLVAFQEAAPIRYA